MAIKLYGIPESRAARCLWLLEELGIPYENVPVHFLGGTRTTEYLKINPNGRIPTLDDGGLMLFESLAINLHLARKYDAGKGLWPDSHDDQSRATQWSFWAATEIETQMVKVLMNRLFLPEAQRSEAAALEGEASLRDAVAVLDGFLEGRSFLLGETFSVADLNVFSVLAWDHRALRTPFLDELDAPVMEKIISLRLSPSLADWAKRCGERPALAQVLAMRGQNKV